MVKIRLARHGRKRLPFYRVVAADIKAPRDGKFLEILGTYNPVEKDESKEVTLKIDRVDYWLGHGAQPTDTVAALIKKFRSKAE